MAIAHDTGSDRDGQIASLLVTPRGCLNPLNGGGSGTHLFLEALARLGPVVVAVNGRPPDERMRAMAPDGVELVALGDPPAGFPGKQRLRRWRKKPDHSPLTNPSSQKDIPLHWRRRGGTDAGTLRAEETGPDEFGRRLA